MTKHGLLSPHLVMHSLHRPLSLCISPRYFRSHLLRRLTILAITPVILQPFAVVCATHRRREDLLFLFYFLSFAINVKRRNYDCQRLLKPNVSSILSNEGRRMYFAHVLTSN